MIKKISILVLLGFIPTMIYSQLIRTEYYNLEWMKARETSYDFKREIYKVDSGFQIKDFNRKGKIQMIGEYSSIDTIVENGHFQFFDKKGVIKSDGDYSNGTMIGSWKNYDKKGVILKDLDYSFDDIVCKEIPRDSVEKQFKTNDGNVIVENMPLFKGQDFKAFQLYVNEQLTFPPMMEKYFISADVKVTFVVHSSGKICSVTINGDAHKDFIRELKRVFLTSPVWTPGIKDKKAVSVQFTLPIKFFYE